MLEVGSWDWWGLCVDHGEAVLVSGITEAAFKSLLPWLL